MGKFTFSVSDLMFLPLFPPCIFSYIFSYILFNCFLFLCYSCVTFFPFPSSSAISSPSLVHFLLHNRYSFLEFYFFSFLPLLVCLSLLSFLLSPSPLISLALYSFVFPLFLLFLYSFSFPLSFSLFPHLPQPFFFSGPFFPLFLPSLFFFFPPLSLSLCPFSLSSLSPLPISCLRYPTIKPTDL